jgi:hypothetical protein
MHNKKYKKRSKFDVGFILVLFFIGLSAVLLAYYIIAAQPMPSSVEVINWDITNASAYSLSVININPIFNLSSKTLYLQITINNTGNSTIGYNAGCISAFYGSVSPNSIANLTYQEGVATCNAITINTLPPKQTVTLEWPYFPQVIKILSVGNFHANLSLPFGFYHIIHLPCSIANSSCTVNSITFNGFTNELNLEIYLSAA